MKYIKLYGYWFQFWKKEALILFLASITTLLSLINPYLTKLIIDKAYGNKDLKLFIILVAIGGIIFVLKGMLERLDSYLRQYIRLRINFNLQRLFFKKLQQLPYRFFQNSSSGENLYKIGYDIEQAALFIANALPQFFSLIPKTILILAIILYMNPRVALFALTLTPFLYIGPYYFSRRLKKMIKIWVENSQNIFQRLEEVLSHMHLVKAFGKEKSETKSYVRNLIQNIRFRLENTKLEESGSFVNSLANRIILGLIIFYGGYQVITGKMTLGSLSAITIYLNQLSGLQSSLAYFFQQISAGVVSCERLNSILGTKTEVSDTKAVKKVKFYAGQMQFNNVTFGYRQDTPPVLNNLNFSIPSGSRIALVGASGCGKTTIIQLFLRLYDPWSGQILIEGYNLRDINSYSLREQVGVALQEPYLWNDTIENNIRYARENATREEIIEVGKVTGVDEFVKSLALDYSTIIGENACKLSEGQKQKIAIARALLKKPKILILDEAMSSMDSLSEEKIIAQINKITGISTTIIVSHRLSTVLNCDLAYFLKTPDTMIIDEPKQLLSKDEAFYNLFAGQIKELSQKDELIILRNNE